MNLLLNFAPVSLSGDTVIDVGYQPYEDELLIRLRNNYRGTHVFRRDYDNNTIIDIPVVSGSKPLSSKIMEIDLLEEWKYWPMLLNEALIRQFDGRREIFSDYPVSVLGDLENNFIQSPNLPDWVQKRSILEFSPKTIFDRNDKAIFGLVCDARSKNLLRGSCQELLSLGVSLVGRYVCVEREIRDSRVLPGLMLVGKVSEVKGDFLHLIDNREGYETVKASEARLSGNFVDFEWCVQKILKGSANSVLRSADQKANSLHSGPGRIQMIENTINLFKKYPLQAVPGVSFDFSDLLNQKNKSFPITETITKPALVFDPSGARTDVWNERVLRSSGRMISVLFHLKN